MSLQDLNLYTDLLSKIITTLGIVVGGFWAYWTFVIRRSGVWNLQMQVLPEILPYRGNLRLLLINVTLRNVGNVKISPGVSGCRLTIKKIPKEIKSGQTIKFEHCKVFVEQFDILEKYKEDGKYALYEIEPNCEFHELETVVVPKGETLFIEVKFFSPRDDDSIIEYRVIKVD